MIYLLDTSALVRLLRDPKLQEAWYDAIDAEAVGSCYPQRAEFLYSTRHAAEYDEIAEMFSDLYPDVAVPEVRQAHLWWGPKRLVFEMSRRGHGTVTCSTVCRVLVRNRLVEPRSRRRRRKDYKRWERPVPMQL